MGQVAPIGVSASGLPGAGEKCNAMIEGKITAVGPTVPFAFIGPFNLAIFTSINTSLTTTAGSLTATVASATGLANGNAIKSVNVPRGTTFSGISGTTITLIPPPVTLYCNGFQIGAPAPFNTYVTVPPGSNTATLVGATVTVIKSDREGITITANTTVSSVVQSDVAPSLNSQGTPGILQLSAAPTAVPPDNNPRPLLFTVGAKAITASSADAAAIFTGAAIAWSGTVQLERSFDGGQTWIVCNVGGAGALAQFTAGPISLIVGEPESYVYYRLNCIAYTSGTINYRMATTGQAATSLAIATVI